MTLNNSRKEKPLSPFEQVALAALPPIPHPAKYLAAVSGGADSAAMLAALARLRGEAHFSLCCAHVNHGLRSPEESAGDAAAVRSLCKSLKVPCRVVSFPPGKIAAFAAQQGTGIEAAARIFRMSALRREAQRFGADYILTAHTHDDLLETLLMRVLRGAGPAGLSPMPPVRGLMLRPLLAVARQDVLAYLAQRDIPYRTDSTNADIRFLRNRIRHKLVPLLDEFFPSWRSSLRALAETQDLSAQFLAAEAQQRLPWTSAAGKLFVPEADFFAAPQILREEAVFAGADKLADLPPASPTATPRRVAVRRAVQPPAAGKPAATDLGPLHLRRRGGYIELEPARPTDRARGAPENFPPPLS